MEWLSSPLVSEGRMIGLKTTRTQCVHGLEGFCETWMECVVISDHRFWIGEMFC